MKAQELSNIKWYHYVANFFAGMTLANVVPHYVNGISGNPFPSPFGNPPGLGNSSPLSNVLWGALNMVFGYLLFRFSKVSEKRIVSLIIFFAGIVCQGIILRQYRITCYWVFNRTARQTKKAENALDFAFFIPRIGIDKITHSKLCGIAY